MERERERERWRERWREMERDGERDGERWREREGEKRWREMEGEMGEKEGEKKILNMTQFFDLKSLYCVRDMQREKNTIWNMNQFLLLQKVCVVCIL